MINPVAQTLLGRGRGAVREVWRPFDLRRGDRRVQPDRSIGHYTHEKNALSAAAALAEIAVIEEEDLCDHAARLGAHALDRLHEMAERHRLIGCVTGIGLHIGIDLVRDRTTK